MSYREGDWYRFIPNWLVYYVLNFVLNIIKYCVIYYLTMWWLLMLSMIMVSISLLKWCWIFWVIASMVSSLIKMLLRGQVCLMSWSINVLSIPIWVHHCEYSLVGWFISIRIFLLFWNSFQYFTLKEFTIVRI